MDRRAVRLLAVVLSVGLLVCCLGPALGSFHNCRHDDCVVCRAIAFVSGLSKAAVSPPLLSAGAALSLLLVLRRQKNGGAVSAFTPVELHTRMLS